MRGQSDAGRITRVKHDSVDPDPRGFALDLIPSCSRICGPVEAQIRCSEYGGGIRGRDGQLADGEIAKPVVDLVPVEAPVPGFEDPDIIGASEQHRAVGGIDRYGLDALGKQWIEVPMQSAVDALVDPAALQAGIDGQRILRVEGQGHWRRSGKPGFGPCITAVIASIKSLAPDSRKDPGRVPRGQLQEGFRVPGGKSGQVDPGRRPVGTLIGRRALDGVEGGRGRGVHDHVAETVEPGPRFSRGPSGPRIERAV
jgi:hypothetical protein